LLKSIKGLGQLAHIILLALDFIAWGLMHVDFFIKDPMQEGVLYIKLSE
jgi:hypothetical protein